MVILELFALFGELSFLIEGKVALAADNVGRSCLL